MSYLNGLVDWLKQRPKIRLQIIIYLQAARCYKTVRKTWLSRLTVEERGLVTGEGSGRWVMPRLHPIFERYQKLSNFVMIYCILKYALPLNIWLDQYLSYNEPYSHCLILGRFVLINKINNDMGLVLACFHLMWRLLIGHIRPQIRLDLIQFLYQNSEDIPHNLNKEIEEPYLRQLVCYKVYKDDLSVVHRVRLNRTATAKQSLEDYFVKTTLTTMGIMLVLVCFMLPQVYLSQCWDEAYVEKYPGCSPELERLIARNEIGFWEIKLTTHRVIASLVDVVENVIVWIDSGLAVTVVIGLAILVNHDLMLCWSQIHLKLEQLEFQIRRQHMTGSMMMNKRSKQQLEEQVFEMQSEILDFFKQLRVADELVSDVMSGSGLIWLISISISCYLCATLATIEKEIRFIQVLCVVAMMVENISLLALSRQVHRSYGLICSIMALDGSANKEKFLIILELYSTTSHSFGPYYSLFHVVAYPSLTFLTLVGWSFSIFVWAETYLVPHQSTSTELKN